MLNFILVLASLYTTVNPIMALLNISDSMNKSILQFEVLAEPVSPSLEMTNSLVTCTVDNVLLNRGAEDVLLQYDYEAYDRVGSEMFCSITTLFPIFTYYFSLC